MSLRCILFLKISFPSKQYIFEFSRNPCFIKCYDDSVDGNSCTVDTCNSGTSQCTNMMSNNCCGNLVCEATEQSSCSDDCGPFTLTAPSGGSWGPPAGVMVDFKAKTDIILQSLTFVAESATMDVTLYTAPGGYSDKATDSGLWTKIVDRQSITTIGEIISNVPINFASDCMIRIRLIRVLICCTP